MSNKEHPRTTGRKAHLQILLEAFKVQTRGLLVEVSIAADF